MRLRRARPRVHRGECKKESTCKLSKCSLVVGASGFEPEASWTRTKRDTKLRHAPM